MTDLSVVDATILTLKDPITDEQSMVGNAILIASSLVGIGANFLVKMAGSESGLNPNAVNRNGGASGLFQFMAVTWASMVHVYGMKYNINVIDVFKPKANAVMGALYILENYGPLKELLNNEPTETDMYMAHFLGLGGAKKFFTALLNNPEDKADTIFPAAAKQNTAIFYDPNKNSLSLAEVHHLLGEHLDRGAKAASIIFDGIKYTNGTDVT